jgi:hypothetical protein
MSAVATSKKMIGDFCKDLPHKDVFILHDAVSLALHLLPEEDHARFRKLWRQFQAKQRKNGGSGCTIEAFISKFQITPTPSTRYRKDSCLD